MWSRFVVCLEVPKNVSSSSFPKGSCASMRRGIGPTSKPKMESAEKIQSWGKNDVEQWIFEVSNSVNIGALILKRLAEFDLKIGDESGGNAWGFTKNRNDSKFFAGELKILDHRVSSIFVYPSNNKFCEICSI